MPKPAVGLVIVTSDPRGGKVAVLQRRGMINPEKDDLRESYPGGCQVTCHGKLEDLELQEPGGYMVALLREAAEELGPEFCSWLMGRTSQFRPLNDSGEIRNFGLYVPETRFLSHIQLGPSTGGLVLVGSVDGIKNLKDFDKATGVTNIGTIAMFPDDKEAVRLALEAFKDL